MAQSVGSAIPLVQHAQANSSIIVIHALQDQFNSQPVLSRIPSIVAILVLLESI